MNTNSVLALSIVLIALVFAVVGFLAAVLNINIKSRTFRKRHAVPDILGKWECQWFDDEGDLNKPKIQDVVEINKWFRDGEFNAIGHQPEFHLSYPISGEVDPSRVVTLEYRAAKYPYEPNRGVVCMILSRDGETMEGKWFGRRYSGNLGGGRVFCSRIHEKELAT
jgi:hypothetical protein